MINLDPGSIRDYESSSVNRAFLSVLPVMPLINGRERGARKGMDRMPHNVA